MRFLQKSNIMPTTGISRRFSFEQPGFVARVSLNSLIIDISNWSPYLNPLLYVAIQSTGNNIYIISEVLEI
jgi:hypothetical protein